MTSFIIAAHQDRDVPDSWQPSLTAEPHSDNCPFCRIIAGDLPAYRVYETDLVIAVLDILPLRPGHTLVIPKTHVSRLSELPVEYAGAVGEAVTRVAKALTEAMENTALNVVCNQEYAQAVPHVHYHIVPAPTFQSSSKISPISREARRTGRLEQRLSHQEMHQREFEAREELDEEEAEGLVERIRSKL